MAVQVTPGGGVIWHKDGTQAGGLWPHQKGPGVPLGPVTPPTPTAEQQRRAIEDQQAHAEGRVPEQPPAPIPEATGQLFEATIRCRFRASDVEKAKAIARSRGEVVELLEVEETVKDKVVQMLARKGFSQDEADLLMQVAAAAATEKEKSDGDE